MSGRRFSSMPVELEPLYEQWRDLFGDIVDGELSIECEHCQSAVYGEGGPVMITCWLCFSGQSSEPSDDPLEA